MSKASRIVWEIKERIAAAGSISVFLDFDGALVPIAADPSAPRLDTGAAETLQLIAGLDSSAITIVSGRASGDLAGRVRMDGVVYAGNHGLEIKGRGLRFVEPAAAARRAGLQRLCSSLAAALRPIGGAMVEYKGLTATAHYRHAAASHHGEVEDLVRRAVLRARGAFRMVQGKCAFEIMPRTDWHRGTAVEWINGQLWGRDALTIYVGGDGCDEEAFSAIRDAITIKVGPAPATCARYRLPDSAAVQEFLLWLAIQGASRPCSARSAGGGAPCERAAVTVQ